MKLAKNLIAVGLIFMASTFFCGCQSNTVDFKYKVKAGTKNEYKHTSKLNVVSLKVNGKDENVPKDEQSLTSIVTEETKSITEKDERNIELSISDAVLNRVIDGKSQEIPLNQITEQKTKYKMTDKGVITEIDGTEVTENSSDIDNSIVSIRFDDKPTTKGESWEVKTEKTVQSGPVSSDKIKTIKTYTFDGYEKYKNKSLAKITEKIDMTMNREYKLPPTKSGDKPIEVPVINQSAKTEGTGTILFDVNKGCIVKEEKNWTITNNDSKDFTKMKNIPKEEQQKMDRVSVLEINVEYELVENEADSDKSNESAKEEKKPEVKKEEPKEEKK